MDAAYPVDAETLSELERIVDAHDSFVHVTHVNPDADGIGSALAFHRHLQAAGKASRLVLTSPMPKRIAFLLREPHEVDVVETAEAAASLPRDAVHVMYDVCDVERLGCLAESVRASSAPLVVFDHHDAALPECGLGIVDPTAGATAELVAEVLRARGVRLDLDLALPLYVGLVSDTGSFNYGKTTPRSHHVAARLIEAGVDPLEVHGELTGRRSLSALRAAGQVMSTLELDPQEPRVAHATVGLELHEAVGGDELETLDLVNHTIALEGVRAGVLLVESEPGSTRLSFRSKGRTSIVEVARSFSGGGHRNAAGAVVEGSADEVRDEVLRRLREAVRRQHG